MKLKDFARPDSMQLKDLSRGDSNEFSDRIEEINDLLNNKDYDSCTVEQMKEKIQQNKDEIKRLLLEYLNYRMEHEAEIERKKRLNLKKDKKDELGHIDTIIEEYINLTAINY